MVSFPTSVWSPTTKTDKVDLVAAAHMNDAQGEVTALETYVGLNPQGTAATLAARLAVCIFADGCINKGSAFPTGSSLVGSGQVFFHTGSARFFGWNGTGWQDLTLGALSNVLFSFAGAVDNVAHIASSSLTSGTGPVYEYWGVTGVQNSNYKTIITTKWTKISTINTVTVWALIWNGGSITSQCKVFIDSLNGSVSGTLNQTTPEWKSFTIDVSGLASGSTYTILIQLANSDAGGGNVYLGSIIAMGS